MIVGRPFAKRLPLLVSILTFAAVSRSIQSPPPPATLVGVARLLGQATGTMVEPNEFLWEPSRGIVLDSLLGRPVLFLGRTGSEQPRDLFRAIVRVSVEGHPVSVQRSVNLTSSPFGDEQGLVGSAGFAAFATVAFGAIQQVTLLDLAGTQVEGGGFERAMTWLTNIQDTGSMTGLGRTEVSTNVSARAARLAFENGTLKVAVEGGNARFAVDLATGQASVEPGSDKFEVTSHPVPHIAKPLIIWGVDTVRAWTGPGPIAWLERNVFDFQDTLKRGSYRAFHKQSAAETLSVSGAPPSPIVPAHAAANPVGGDVGDGSTWPPSPLRSIWQEAEPGEGEWKPVRLPFLKHNVVQGSDEQPPPYYMQTFVRPDPDRPYVKVLLVAMDARQLELGMEGGIEDPQPLTGAHGEGRIPRDPSILSRAVGAFNGAFKTTHGEYGMMVNRRVLLPPKPNAASIVVTQSGQTGFGTWPDGEQIPPDIVSFRQNMEPLVEDGKVNPSDRKQWGWHLHGTKMLTHRSGLCLTAGGHMIYAWGAEVTGTTLGNAMVQAGCEYGVHLDMNPHHTAFVFLDVRNVARREYDTQILTPEMQVLPDRYLLWSPKDFFYLTLRQFGPVSIDGVQFEPDAGLQPAPRWAPAFYKASVSVGRGTVRLIGISPHRVNYALRTPRLGHPMLEGIESKQVLAALPLGSVGEGEAGLGLEVKAGKLTMGETPVETGFRLIELRGTHGAKKALCVGEDGWVWLAESDTENVPVGKVLGRVGCSKWGIVPETNVLHRVGAERVPLDRYDQPVLYVFGTPLVGAFRWAGGK